MSTRGGCCRGACCGLGAAAGGADRELRGVLGSNGFALEDFILGGEGRSSLLHTRFGGGVGFITERMDFSGFFDTRGVRIGGISSSLV